MSERTVRCQDGFAVGPTNHGKGTKIMAIAAVTRTGVSCDATSDVGLSSGYLRGCNGSGDWSRYEYHIENFIGMVRPGC
jgi:hypothetical protein